MMSFKDASDSKGLDYERIISTIEENVKCERELIELLLHACLSAWAPHPMNIVLKGEPSIGKTYTAVNVSRILPSENVWLLGGLSPTALVHDRGVLVDSSGMRITFPGDELSEEEKLSLAERMREARYEVDLTRKVLIFLEAPRRETFDMLRPILSHDTREISYKFTDRSGRGRLRTFHVVLKGWPASIFCSANMPWMSDFVSRCLTVNPKEFDEEKFREAHKVTARRFRNPIEEGIVESKFFNMREELKALLNDDIRAVIPYADRLSEIFPTGRDEMRFFRYFLTLIEVHTVFDEHPSIDLGVYGRYRIATLKDLDDILRIWGYAYETTKTGLRKSSLAILNLLGDEPKSPREIYEEACRAGYKMSMKAVYASLTELRNAYYVEESTDPNDRRRKLFTKITGENLLFYSNRRFPGLFGGKELSEWLENILQKTPNVIIYFRDREIRIARDEKSIIDKIGVLEEYFLGKSKGQNGEISPEIFYWNKIEDLQASPHTLESRGVKPTWVRIGELRRFARCEFCGKLEGYFKIEDQESREVRIVCYRCLDELRRDGMLKSRWSG
jgi:DNA-binding transcriptional ArsR family regulator